jgi:hypothetical protein
MQEFRNILAKYDAPYVEAHFHTATDINKFATTFYKDAAEIYDCLTRVRNLDRNPVGFSLEDAPILGLLVRMWKLLKAIIRYYEEENAELIAVLERPLIEAAVTAEFLMRGGEARMMDYRKCSYKDRLRLLSDLKEGSPFFNTKAGQRLLKSIREKMAFETLTPDDFQEQKRNRWRLQNKTFRDIFTEVVGEDLYTSTYGMMSESVHGSWNESWDYSLRQNDDGTFGPYPFFQPADIRFVSPTLRFCNPPFRLWLQRIDVRDPNLDDALAWIERVNRAVFLRFDQAYDGAVS